MELNQEPNVDYLGHPINAYNLIKHTAMGWKDFHFNINPTLNETISNLEYFMNRANNTAISGFDEVEGAAFGVARLQHQYNLEPNSYFLEGIVETNLNLKHVRSKQSIRKFTSDDLYQISTESKKEGLMTTAIDSLKCAIELAKSNDTSEDYLNMFEDQKFDLPLMEKQYQKIIDNHDQTLLRRGSRQQGTRYFTHPVGNKLTKKEVKKIAKNEKKLAEAKMIREDQLEDGIRGYDSVADHYLIQEQNYHVAIGLPGKLRLLFSPFPWLPSSALFPRVVFERFPFH